MPVGGFGMKLVFPPPLNRDGGGKPWRAMIPQQRSCLLLPSTFPSIRVFSTESALHIRWPKYWSFSFNISPSNEHPGLISFRMDWLDLLASKGKARAELRPARRKARLPHSRSLLLPGRER